MASATGRSRQDGRASARVLAVVGLLVVSGPAFAQDYTPPQFPGTGPYRRVYSHSEYSYASAIVTLPSAPAISIHGSDTPYVYMGGWGTNGQGAADAGFQYSPTFNNWSLFIAGVGVGRVDDTAPRFRAGQDVTLTFQVVTQGSETALRVTADGIDINGNPAHRTLSVANVAGWTVGGPNTLKRMTSIAQTSDDFTDGSFINGVHWYSSMIGTSAADAHPWLAADTGGYQSYPSTGGVVLVNYVNAGEETDSIHLTPAPEPATAGVFAAAAAGLVGLVRSRRAWAGANR